jgi:hypothetical protein
MVVDGSFSDSMPSCPSGGRVYVNIPSSFLRDVKLVLISFVATCIIIFAYNYYLQKKCDAIPDDVKVG